MAKMNLGIILMFGLFKPKEFRTVHKLLESNNFFSKDFARFNIDDIAFELVENRRLNALTDVLKATKMDHVRLLKAVLLVLRFLQMAPKMQESTHIENVL